MSVHTIEVTTENLLGIVSQMPETEFNQFFQKAQKLRQKAVKSNWTKDEITLIKGLNDYALSNEKQIRFNQLVKKRRDEKIDESELQELIILNKESESLNNKRLKILAKLATARHKTLSEIMDILEIHPPKVI